MNDVPRTAYRVIQKGLVANEPVGSFDSLVTHHPSANRNAHMEAGVIVDGERGRRHAYIGGEIQEIEFAREGNSYGLKLDQVLLKKDFKILHRWSCCRTALEGKYHGPIGRRPQCIFDQADRPLNIQNSAG